VNAFALALVATALAGSPVGQRAKQFAAKCAVTIPDFRERVFADAGNDKWKEYGSAKEFPAPESEWFEVARIWTKAGLPTVVEIEGIGQDFSDYTLYCFDGGGVFGGLDHEFRTEWGWGFREIRSIGGGDTKFESHFFETKTGRRIPRPVDADSVAEAMQLRIYRKLNDVPFFAMLGDRCGPS
jgi:hypothetical protein